MGYDGPPWDARGDGAIISPEEEASTDRKTFEAPDRVADHIRRTR